MKICDVLALLNEPEQLNEGFYAYHCTRAQIEEFKDEHENEATNAGAFWGSGTYFEVLDRDGNFSDYGDESFVSGYRKGKGQQYKVYIDLEPQQILDTTKSFNDYGLNFSTEEAIDFILHSPLLEHDGWRDRSIKKFFELKEQNNNFNDIFSKRSALPHLIQIIDGYINSMQSNGNKVATNFKFKKIIDSIEKSKFISTAIQYSKYAAEILGENDFNDDAENKLKEMIASGDISQAAGSMILSVMKYLGDTKKVEQMVNHYIQFFFKVIKVTLNKYPMYCFIRWRSTANDIKWFMKKLGVYGKIVPETGLNDSGSRRYLIMWKTTGIVKKVGERYKKSEKFTDEIEDEAQQDEIDNMLQYAGA